MKVRNHPKIIIWPPAPGGPNAALEYPREESQSIVTHVYRGSAQNRYLSLNGEFKGNPFTYDVFTKDRNFAKRLAEEFSRHVGDTLQQFGDVDIDF
jgi:hypothetical protein